MLSILAFSLFFSKLPANLKWRDNDRANAPEVLSYALLLRPEVPFEYYIPIFPPNFILLSLPSHAPPISSSMI
jgi:hypothetical protein